MRFPYFSCIAFSFFIPIYNFLAGKFKHLTEAGRLSWHPLGNLYLWSEYYNLSSLLSQEGKIGWIKEAVCSPTDPEYSVSSEQLPSWVSLIDNRKWWG